MAFYENAVYSLQNLGLVDIFLPFILIFTIIFATLQKTRILGVGKKNFNIIVAFVMAMTVIVPHVTRSYPPGKDVVDILNQALPQVSVVFVAIIMVLILIGLLGGEARWMGGSMSGWIAIIAFFIIIGIFGRAAGWWATRPSWLYWIDNPNTTGLVVVLLVFGVIIWFVTKEDTGTENLGKMGYAIKQFGDFFKGGGR